MKSIYDLPENLQEYMKNNTTDLADGYVRFLNEKDIDRIDNILDQSTIWNGGIPFATTVFGDVLAWESGYVILYKFTEDDYNVMLSGTDFFFSNLEDEEYRKDFFDMDLFYESMEKFGEIDHNECYVLEPIPKLGGLREIKYVNIGELEGYLNMLVS